MIDLPSIESINATLNQPLDEALKRLLEDRLADTIHCGLQDYTHVLVVEAGDTERQIVEAIGFSPLETRIDNRPNCPDSQKNALSRASSPKKTSLPKPAPLEVITSKLASKPC